LDISELKIKCPSGPIASTEAITPTKSGMQRGKNKMPPVGADELPPLRSLDRRNILFGIDKVKLERYVVIFLNLL
jgi:hypothetical protein